MFSQNVLISFLDWNEIAYEYKPFENYDLLSERNFKNELHITSVGELKGFYSYIKENNICSLTAFRTEIWRSNTDSSVSTVSFSSEKNEIEIYIIDNGRDVLTHEKLSFNGDLIKEIIYEDSSRTVLNNHKYKCSYSYDNRNLRSIGCLSIHDNDTTSINYEYFYSREGRLNSVKRTEIMVDSMNISCYEFSYNKDSILTFLNNKIIKKFVLDADNRISKKYYYKYDEFGARQISSTEEFYHNLVYINIYRDNFPCIEYFNTYENGHLKTMACAARRDFPEQERPLFLASRTYVYENNLISKINSLHLYDLDGNELVKRCINISYIFRVC